MKKLAISILNRNGLTDTIECIDSILASDFHDYKIYLLDNGSHNIQEYNTLKEKYKEHHNIIVHHSTTNLWFTWGNNHNLKTIMDSTSEYIMLLNNDCKIEKDFLSKFISHIEKIHKKWIFWPIIKGYDGSIQAAWSSVNLRTGSSKRAKTVQWTNQIVDYVTGSCMIISREIIEKIWFLDDRYFAYREESDFCLRAKKIWYDTYVMNVDGIYHKEESANKKIKPYYTYLMFRNRILFLKKHANILQYISSYIILFVYLIIIFPRYFGIKNYRYALKGIWHGIRNIWWN